MLFLSFMALSLLTGWFDQGFDATKELSVISREACSGTTGAFIELFGIE